MDAKSPEHTAIAETMSSAAGLRVLLLNYEYPPLGGGAGVATANLARALAGAGAVVDVVTAGAGPGERRTGGERAGLPETPLPGLSIYRLRTRRKGVHQAGMGGAASYVVAALPLVRRLVATRRYDVVHCFFSLPTGLLLPLAGLGRRQPRPRPRTVISLRGSDVPGYDRSNHRLERVHRLLLPLTRHLWRSADRVAAVCAALGELARAALPSLEYAVVHNGVDLELFRPPEQARMPRVDRVRCIAVARLIERKGIADLLHAWTRLERGRFELEIVGEGGDAPALRALAGTLGLGGEVCFTGALEHAALAERYRAADLFTLAPLDEAFGNVFAEALASGLPIVGSDVGGIPELVRPGVHGLLVPPGRPELLAGAIRALADDPVRRASMAERNRAHAERTLSWSAATERYLDLYAALLAVPALTPVPAAEPVAGFAVAATE